MFVVANPSLVWSEHHSQRVISTQIQHQQSWMAPFWISHIFLWSATAERQLWTISTNLFSKGCIDKSIVVDASSHRANVFITVAAIIYTSTTFKLTWDAETLVYFCVCVYYRIVFRLCPAFGDGFKYNRWHHNASLTTPNSPQSWEILENRWSLSLDSAAWPPSSTIRWSFRPHHNFCQASYLLTYVALQPIFG
jgi:hypothetical protein